MQKNFLLHNLLCGVQVFILKPFILFLSLSFALPNSRENGLLLWKSGIFFQCSEVLLELFHTQMNFLYICGEGGHLPALEEYR